MFKTNIQNLSFYKHSSNVKFLKLYRDTELVKGEVHNGGLLAKVPNSRLSDIMLAI